MKYILNPNIALRSWRLVPYAYYIRHRRDALGLKQEEFELLKKCDGVCELSVEEEAALRPLAGDPALLPGAHQGKTHSLRLSFHLPALTGKYGKAAPAVRFFLFPGGCKRPCAEYPV